MTEFPRRLARVTLGSAAILSVAEAVALLPWRDFECRRWLEQRELIRRRADVPGPYVHWGEVEAELRTADPVELQGAPEESTTLQRAGLRRS